MTTAPGSPEATSEHAPRRAPPESGPQPSAPPDEFGGEVRIGGGPGPRWLRLWYYVVYLWAIGYLFGAFLLDRVRDGEGRYYEIVAAFGVLLTIWLGYIIWKKRPPEP